MKHFLWDKLKLIGVVIIIGIIVWIITSFINKPNEPETFNGDKWCINQFGQEICDLLPYASEEQLGDMIKAGYFDDLIIQGQL